MTRRTLACLALGAAVSAISFTVACGGDDSSGATNPTTGDSGTPADTGTPPGDSAAPTDGGNPADSGGLAALYASVGYSGLHGLVAKIVEDEATDSTVGPFFSLNAANDGGGGGATDRESVEKIIDNFSDFVAFNVFNDTSHPYNGHDLSVHQQFGIPYSAFEQFITIAAADLTAAGATPDDVTQLGGILESLKDSIVNASVADGSTFNGLLDGGTVSDAN